MTNNVSHALSSPTLNKQGLTVSYYSICPPEQVGCENDPLISETKTDKISTSTSWVKDGITICLSDVTTCCYCTEGGEQIWLDKKSQLVTTANCLPVTLNWRGWYRKLLLPPNDDLQTAPNARPVGINKSDNGLSKAKAEFVVEICMIMKGDQAIERLVSKYFWSYFVGYCSAHSKLLTRRIGWRDCWGFIWFVGWLAAGPGAGAQTLAGHWGQAVRHPPVEKGDPLGS